MSSYNANGPSTPNPLRPYYIPQPPVPLNATVPDPAAAAAATAATAVANSSSSSTAAATAANAPSSSSYLDGLGDLQDYSDYLDGPPVQQLVRNLFNQAVLSYTSVLIAQPFDVAKTVLQVQALPKREAVPAGKKPQTKGGWREGDGYSDASDSEDDEPRYFSSNLSDDSPPTSPTNAPHAPRRPTDRGGYVLEHPEDDDIPQPEWHIKRCREGAVGEVLKALWAKEGAWGIWKGQNATFVYSVLVSTVESFANSVLAACLSLPDPGATEIADSTHPLATLGIAVAASAVTALILSPLDTVRTKLTVTPRSSSPRNVLPALRTLPTWFSSSLLIPTTLYSTLPNIISLGTPYLLKTRLNLDPLRSPVTYSIFSFLVSTAELVVRLPLETVLRRAQVDAAKPERTIVPAGRYAGVIGTAWVVVKEEQSGGRWGLGGLYRGWRVAAWGNVGVLGLSLFGLQHAGAGEF